MLTSLNKEGQNLFSLHASGSICPICTLGYSDSLTPHRWSRRNQVSNFENKINRNPLKGENRKWWLRYFNQSCLKAKCDGEKSDV